MAEPHAPSLAHAVGEAPPRNGTSTADGQLVPPAALRRGRALSSVTVDSFDDLATQVGGSANEIRVAVGTYAVTSTLSVSRSVTIRADVESATVVLDGEDARRVVSIASGNVELIGLSITGGYTWTVHRGPLRPIPWTPLEVVSWH